MTLSKQYADELASMLAADQKEKRTLGRAYFHAVDKGRLQALKSKTKQNEYQRSRRMLEILHEIGEPSIATIGTEGAQALSILALHDATVLEEVLIAFNKLYEKNRDDCYYQAIPSMADLLLLMRGKPQRFGTQWMFDATKRPFLPTVEDVENVNERRKEYGIEPLRWPKSLAIPEAEQPWLARPLSEAMIRDMTDGEWREFIGG